jgi:Uma2 family endonuclease
MMFHPLREFTAVASHALISAVSIQDYLTSEQAGEIRHEYIAGQLFAMVGASRAHNTIALNIASFLHVHLRGSSYQAFMAGMKVRVERIALSVLRTWLLSVSNRMPSRNSV